MDKQKPKLVPGAQENKPVTAAIKAALEKKPIQEGETKPNLVSEAKPAPVVKAEYKDSGKLTQREAVYIDVCREIHEHKIIIALRQPVKEKLSEENIKRISARLVKMFQAETITLKDTPANKKKLNDPKALELYVVGLVNNWLRRDKRLNGSTDIKFYNPTA